jgi:thiol:disulfide interchange protein/DsbC/DsbD-like thiol-disulfide interchange protein
MMKSVMTYTWWVKKAVAGVLLLLLLGVIWMLGSISATAQQMEAINPGNATIVSEVEDIASARPFWLLIQVEPTAGMTSSWRTGQPGEPHTSLDWRLPPGFALGAVRFQVPELYPDSPDQGYGYSGKFNILAEIIPPGSLAEGNGSARLWQIEVGIDWFECNGTCTANSRALQITLPPGLGQPNPAVTEQFYLARQSLAAPLPWAVDANIQPGRSEIKVYLPTADRAATTEVRFIPITPGLAEKDFEYDWQGDVLVITADRPAGAPYAVDAEGLLVLDFEKGLHNSYHLLSNNLVREAIDWLPPRAAGPKLSLTMALGLAFLGGLILNLMPCVFPILAMKAFSVVNAAGQSKKALQADSILYAAGIIGSFLVIAGLLIAIKAAGVQAGWGFQLQSPGFILTLILIMSAVALNFSGLFEIGGTFQGLGQGLSEKQGGLGSFGTGVLATLVATPCTAPFMAPAIGYSLAQPAVISLSIFVSLGAGMAAPYVLVSYLPGAQRLLPKPGPWMVKFKRWLALPMALTVVWLVWVLARQTDTTGLLVAFVAVLVMAGGLWMLSKPAMRNISLALIAGSFALVLVVQGAGEGARAGKLDVSIEGFEVVAYSPEAIEELQRQRRPIFLNVTAAWCITCLVHEELIFNRPEFQTFLAENDIVYMVADWTNPDPRIAALLAKYDRSGIPFYLFYPSGGIRPAILLPELLTPQILLRVLEDNL